MLRATDATRNDTDGEAIAHDCVNPQTDRRQPFTPRLLPLTLAATLGIVGAAFFASRDAANAQPAFDATAKVKPAHRTGQRPSQELSGKTFEAQVAANVRDSLDEGRNTFRFDTFGDEDFWGGTLQLHQAIEGSAFGGVGPGITPRNAIDLGLKVDAAAIRGIQGQLQSGGLDLNSPAGTLAFLKANAVVVLTWFFNPDG